MPVVFLFNCGDQASTSDSELLGSWKRECVSTQGTYITDVIETDGCKLLQPDEFEKDVLNWFEGKPLTLSYENGLHRL